ncbi:MAG: DNA adenine methylase [Ignavibacteria bacterium]|nr:DNA adenine methylase [Ignavibacteria bacterium]
MLKSPLRYPGGKSRAIPLMSKLIPDFKEYREPFLGGGSLFVYLKQRYHDKKYWLNDIYIPLFHFWNELKINSQKLLDIILKWKSEYKSGKELHSFLQENIDKFDNIYKAAAFFVFNRITFSGTSESGGYSEAAFKGRFTDSSIERVKLLSTILSDVKITNLDYSQLINKSGENVFIYLDPPYYSATKSALYGKNGILHKTFDHEKFAENMKRCNHRWLITYDDCEYIRKLFFFSNIFDYDLKYGMRNVTNNSNQIGKELFISNYLTVYPIGKQSELFEKELVVMDKFNGKYYIRKKNELSK